MKIRFTNAREDGRFYDARTGEMLGRLEPSSGDGGMTYVMIRKPGSTPAYGEGPTAGYAHADMAVLGRTKYRSNITRAKAFVREVFAATTWELAYRAAAAGITGDRAATATDADIVAEEARCEAFRFARKIAGILETAGVTETEHKAWRRRHDARVAAEKEAA